MKYSELNERKKHGTEGFPIEYYYVDKAYHQYEMPLHWHKEFEILRVKSGSLTLFVDDLEYCLGAGDIITVNCGSLHRGVPKDCVYECVVVDLDMLLCSYDSDNYFRPIINGENSIHVLLNQTDGNLYRIASDVFGAMLSRENFNKLSVMSSLFAFFNELYKSNAVTPHRKPRNANHTRVVSQIIDWIEDNIAESVSLEALSQKAGLNPKYFCRVFKASTGKTPIDYINSSKIEHACQLIAQGESITESAVRCGFSDMCYFSKMFKKHRGLSPTEWRKALKRHELTDKAQI